MFAAAGAMALALSSVSQAQQIAGDYIETRSADVWTGPCFANAEVGLAGDQAILAWRVQKGDWNGECLDGLGIVAVVKAHATLGDPTANPYPAKSVLIVDDRASADQRAALISFAKKMAGELLDGVVSVEVAQVKMDVTHQNGHYGKVQLRAGTFAGIETRSLSEKDHFCGNEDVYYDPLVKLNHAMPAVAMLDEFKGPGLGVSWTTHGKRSAFVGSFSR